MISKTASNTTLDKRPMINLRILYIIAPTIVVM
jgi:hypothetical protein